MNKVDLLEAVDFLEQLEPGGTFYFRAIHPDPTKKAVNLEGRSDECLVRLERLNIKGYGIYVVVNGGGHKAAAINSVRALFADYDDPEKDAFELANACPFEPSLIVETSPKKFHFYWIFLPGDPYPLTRIQDEGGRDLEKFIAMVGSDPCAKGLPRLMRIPGFFHTKGEPFLSRIVHTGPRCGWSQFGEWLSAIHRKMPPASGALAPEMMLTPYASAALERGIGKVATACNGERHTTLNREAFGLFGLVKGGELPEAETRDKLYRAATAVGLPDSEVDSVLRDTWRDASRRSKADYLSDFTECRLPDEEPAKPMVAPTLPDYPIELLTLPGYLGELQAFIHGRMAYPSAATAGVTAFATLTAFAQTNLLISSRSGLGFNEQYMILAPTGFGKEDLRGPLEVLYRKSGDYMSLCGGDASESLRIRHAAPASAQGIHQILEENRSVIFLSDEFAEWLRMSHKDGQKQQALGYLMQAYTKATGIVEPGHAVTRKYEPVKDPRLSILATSTGEAIFETMTKEQAESGAYNRWVIFAGDTELPPKRYEGLVYEPSNDLVDFVAWVRGLKPQKIPFTKDGWEAFKQLDAKLAEPIKRRDGVLGGRLAEQAIKLSGLLALSDRRTEIQADDLSIAFNIRVGLYHRAKDLADCEGSLDGKDATVQAMDQVVGLLKKRPEVYKSQLANLSRKYRGLSVQQQQIVLRALVEQGYAAESPASPKILSSLVYQEG